MYRGIDAMEQNGDNERQSQRDFLHPDFLKSDILEMKSIIDNIITDSSNKGKGPEDIKNDSLDELKKKRNTFYQVSGVLLKVNVMLYAVGRNLKWVK